MLILLENIWHCVHTEIHTIPQRGARHSNTLTIGLVYTNYEKHTVLIYVTSQIQNTLNQPVQYDTVILTYNAADSFHNKTEKSSSLLTTVLHATLKFLIRWLHSYNVSTSNIKISMPADRPRHAQKFETQLQNTVSTTILYDVSSNGNLKPSTHPKIGNCCL